MKQSSTLLLRRRLGRGAFGGFSISKRKKFVISVSFLTLGLFIAENLFGRFGFYVTIFLSLLSALLFYGSIYKDLKGNFSLQPFILPFFYTLSFGLFYFIAPSRILTRLILTSVYFIGLYSLFLSHNIFVVASLRTIALVSGARIVSFIITLISFFFLSKVVFTLNLPFYIKVLFLFLCSYLLITQSIWTITLERSFRKNTFWAFLLSLTIIELFLALLFWPTVSTYLAIFFTGFFYSIIGLSHAWFDKRLFKGVLWEYIWWGVIVFCILIIFTPWRG